VESRTASKDRTVVVGSHLDLKDRIGRRLADLADHQLRLGQPDGERRLRRAAGIDAQQLVQRDAETLAREVVQGHVHRRLRRALPLLGRPRGGLGERLRVRDAAGHHVERGRHRLRVLLVAADGRGLAPADVPVLLDLDQHVAAGVGRAAGDAEGVAELEVEGPVSEDDHLLPLSGV
jgi:hypothetical protein